MSYGREHRYNEAYGGDVIIPEPCDPCKSYSYNYDHVNCKDICCTTKDRPHNNKACKRSCCTVKKQKVRCSSAYCPICDVCQKCYCYCKCYCYHACHIECCNDHCDVPKEVIHCKPIYKKAKKYERYYCNPYYVQNCECGRRNCDGQCR
jgi:hypothetical protein